MNSHTTPTILTIPEVIAKVRDLPALPAVVMELLDTIGNDDIDVGTLAAKVSQDQALTAKALRLANSSFYGMQRKVTTIAQAMSILGFQTVSTLITTAAVTSSFSVSKDSTLDFAAFWRHSLATAVCAKVLARHVGLNQEYAFMAGLLHDIGRLVLVTCYPGRYDRTLAYRDDQDCYLFEAEHQVLQIDHAMVGHALTEHWKFPDMIRKAVAFHHDPEALDAGDLAMLVHIANSMVHALDLSGEEHDLVPPVSDVAWNRFALSDTQAMSVLHDTRTQFTEACRMLPA